jgi:N-methylhydantoinase A
VNDYRLAVDIGGTFTDVVVESPSGQVRTFKVLSTPNSLVTGVIEGIEATSAPLNQVGLFVHGTTAGVNALLQRKGARVALVTSAGFRDVYHIGRGNRPAMYDLRYHRPPRLVDRASIYEVTERIGPDGMELEALDEGSVIGVAAAIAKGGYEAVAVCLIHAYANGEHELAVRRLLAEQLPNIPIVLSHEVAPEWREYERTSTTVMSAYITPIMSHYVGVLDSALQERGLKTPVYITESNGGVMNARLATEKAVLTLFSGPVGGVVGTRALGGVIGEGNLISADVGGTSFDVSLIRDGTAPLQPEFELQGLPILAPAVEVNTIGAGGGSLIYEVDGRLQVGPESAGAFPGPACYGLGGTIPTVTDANLLLGRLPASHPLAGKLAIDFAAARDALASVAARFDLDPIQLAEQALEIIHFKMAEAIREITVERGFHPRDFVLCAFGGAGGLHATALAEELEIERIVIPHMAGSFSAWGMLQGNIRHDVVQTFYRDFDRAVGEIDLTLASLRDAMARILATEGISESDMRFEAAADMRYVGQEYSLTLPLQSWGDISGLDRDFHTAYKTRYGHSNPKEKVEFVALRVAGIADLRHSQLGSRTDTLPSDDGVVTVQTRLQGKDWDTKVIRRESLTGSIQGPAIVLEETATTLVSPGWVAKIGAGGHLFMDRIA